MMDDATRALVADVSASLLLFMVFVVLLAALAGLFLFWRGLRAARSQLSPAIARLDDVAADVQDGVLRTATTILEPPIRAASTVAGLRAAAKVLLGKDGSVHHASNNGSRRSPL